MGGLNVREVYPGSILVEVECNGTTAIAVWAIPAGTLIEQVLARIKVAGVGAANLTVGDDDAATGFLVAADTVVAVGTVYGEVPTTRGAYLYDATVKAGYIKLYASAGKSVKIVLSGAQTTNAVVQVLIKCARMALS